MGSPCDTKDENFPVWIVLLSNLVALSIYAIGAYILAGFGSLFSFLYLFYCLWIEIRILKGSCVGCFYYGKLCGLGRGKLCPFLFRRGDPRKFAEKEASWSMMLPDFIVLLLPLIGGIILLITEFEWLLLAMLAMLAILSFAGNAIIRGSLACKYCRQREIGCPAEKLFSK